MFACVCFLLCFLCTAGASISFCVLAPAIHSSTGGLAFRMALVFLTFSLHKSDLSLLPASHFLCLCTSVKQGGKVGKRKGGATIRHLTVTNEKCYEESTKARLRQRLRLNDSHHPSSIATKETERDTKDRSGL